MTHSHPEILFITRKYPPSIGGMQTFSYELIRNISKKIPIKTITWGKSQAYLPWFFLKALFMGSYYIKAFNIRKVHFGDALLSPLGIIFKFLFQVKLGVTVHGLDIIYPLKIYQFTISKMLCFFDFIFSVSNNTKKELTNRGIPIEKIYVVPNGINGSISNIQIPLKWKEEFFLKNFGLNVENKKLLITVGRLVKRKGHAFFLKEVFPELIKLHPDLVYCIVGEGKEKNRINELIKGLNLGENAILAGTLTGENLSRLYLSADLFIMPNIPVSGDSEGFGIVALEATAHKLPVVASNLDGIKDAIVNERNGFLVEASSMREFVGIICKLLDDLTSLKDYGEKFYLYTIKNYSWENIVNKYLKILYKN